MDPNKDKQSVSSRFVEKTEEQRQEILDDRIKKNTKKVTKVWLNVITYYMKEKKLGLCIDKITTKDLPNFLFKFYSEVRRENGELYSNTLLKSMRAGINRYIKETRSIDIVSNGRFIKANELFKGVQLQGKKAGKGRIKHKEHIEPQDLECLQDYFSKYMEPNPEILQQYVMFNVIYYLCRRGRQNLATLTVDMFEVTFQV